jgi:hypothetical protein
LGHEVVHRMNVYLNNRIALQHRIVTIRANPLAPVAKNILDRQCAGGAT